MKHSKKALAVIAVFFLASGIFMASSPQYQKRFESIANTTTDRSNGDRIVAWKACIKMAEDHPLTGIGLGRWGKVYGTQYWTPEDTQKLPHAHSNYFHMLAETGIIGFLGLLYFTIYFVSRSFINWKKNKNPYDLMACISFLGYVVFFGQIEYTLDLTSGVRILWFLEATMFGLKQASLERVKVIP